MLVVVLCVGMIDLSLSGLSGCLAVWQSDCLFVCLAVVSRALAYKAKLNLYLARKVFRSCSVDDVVANNASY